MSKDPKKRIKEHNNGETKSTKHFRPYELIYTELVGNRIETRKREKYLKSGIGREWIKTNILGL